MYSWDPDSRALDSWAPGPNYMGPNLPEAILNALASFGDKLNTSYSLITAGKHVLPICQIYFMMSDVLSLTQIISALLGLNWLLKCRFTHF